MITADSGRAVTDSGRVVLLDMSETGSLSIKNILAMLQSDETIWAKLFEFAADCFEECELTPHSSTCIVPRFTISLKQIYRECEIGPCVRRMERLQEIARLLSQISDTPSAISP